MEIGGKLLAFKFVRPESPRRKQNPQQQLPQQRISPDLLIGSLKMNLSLTVMMSAVNSWKPPQPPRRQRVVTKVFYACNVCISDISGKLAPGSWRAAFLSSTCNRISAPFPTLLHHRQSDDDLKFYPAPVDQVVLAYLTATAYYLTESTNNTKLWL